MASKDSSLTIDYYSNRFAARSAPSAGTSCVATQAAPASPISRINVENVLYSIRNSTAAGVTYTLSVRDASSGGTVLADFDFVVATATQQQGSLYVQVPGLRGNAVVAEFGTPASSVTQKVIMTGFLESLA
jgi:hypothetical protein